MGSIKKSIDPGGSYVKDKKKKKRKEEKIERIGEATAAAKAAAADTAARKAARRRSIYGFGGIFGSGQGEDSDAIVRARRLLGTA